MYARTKLTKVNITYIGYEKSASYGSKDIILLHIYIEKSVQYNILIIEKFLQNTKYII